MPVRFGIRAEQAKWELALPDGARRLIASGDFDGRDKETLACWLRSEPVLSQRLLVWCNTPMYNLSRPYQTLDDAARVMEPCDLSRLAFLCWVRGMMLPEKRIDNYSRDRLWAHSIAVGSVANLIARTCALTDPGLVMVAGTLHDIGMLASEKLDPVAFAETISQTDHLSPLHEVEQEILGWDHTQLGQIILRQWGMPDAVQTAARYHHEPDRILGQPDGQTVACVAIANFLCNRSGWSSTKSAVLLPPSEATFGLLGIDSALLAVLWQQLYPAIESASGLR
ncbi:HDOD domain protein [Rubripirellula lacrimiformis]|uniref:HDOD domain protein n=1 Tax=Rubripirellula lacrimiformis TaxID=1930273 RepID=A0A517NHF7_9BACT|nr:HDOD domain-containing protein [Rubripirellula lacrimiformis]QDT06575.1 HDOD domain protein [Rubripirellula lacrimiformis]